MTYESKQEIIQRTREFDFEKSIGDCIPRRMYFDWRKKRKKEKILV